MKKNLKNFPVNCINLIKTSFVSDSSVPKQVIYKVHQSPLRVKPFRIAKERSQWPQNKFKSRWPKENATRNWKSHKFHRRDTQPNIGLRLEEPARENNKLQPHRMSNILRFCCLKIAFPRMCNEWVREREKEREREREMQKYSTLDVRRWRFTGLKRIRREKRDQRREIAHRSSR